MNANCTNTVGGHNCTCKEGFAGDGRSCSGKIGFVPQYVKVSARVKKANFSKFLISRCSDKAFQKLSFKKNSTKKYSFSAKLLDVEVYYTLTVLITR